MKNVITYETFLNEGLSNILYHATDLWNAASVFTDNEFRLSAEPGSPKVQRWFLSCSREKYGGYARNSDLRVTLVLDGRTLGAKFKGEPFDYWKKKQKPNEFIPTPRGRAEYLGYVEAEDRVISNQPTIGDAKKYITEVHVFIDKYLLARLAGTQPHPDNRFMMREASHQIDALDAIQNGSEVSGITTHFYINKQHYQQQHMASAFTSWMEVPGVSVEYVEKVKDAMQEIEVAEAVSTVVNGAKLYKPKKDNIYKPREVGDYGWHQTAIDDAKTIIKDGFKTGHELRKGENDYGVFFSPTHRGQEDGVYNRMGYKARSVMVRVDLRGLKLFDVLTIEKKEGTPSYRQPRYSFIHDIKHYNKWPAGYDGVLNKNDDGEVYEIILKPEVATERLDRTGVYNSRGQKIPTPAR